MDNEELEKLFDACDVTGNGHLDKNEFARLCEELSLKEDELQSLFRSVDINKDGIIQKSEFFEKFHVVADVFFGAMQTNDVNSSDVTNQQCDVTERLGNGNQTFCDNNSEQLADDDNSYTHNVTKIDAGASIDNQDGVISSYSIQKSKKLSFSAPINESSFMVSPPPGEPPRKRTSTPRPGVGSRGSRSSRFNVAKSDKSWDKFAESIGNIIYSLSSYDSISSLYKRLNESDDHHVINNYEAMLQNLLKDIENMQLSINELEGSLQRATDKSSEQLSILEEEMEAQISLKEQKVRKEERERAEEEERKLRMEYEDRIARLQQAVHKLKQVDERLSKVSPLESEVEKLRDKLRAVTAENTNLSSRLTEAETQGVLLKTQLAALQVELQENRMIVDRENDAVRRVLTEQETMTHQVHTLTNHNRKLRDSNDDLLEVLESKMAAYKRLSTQLRSPSASFNGDFASTYSSAAPSRLEYQLQSGRSSRASYESEALAICDPKLSSIISEEDDVSHDDDTDADYSFKSSVDGAMALVSNGFERDSGIGTIRDEHDTDTEVDGARSFRHRFSANRLPVGAISSATSLRSSSTKIIGRHDVSDDDVTDDDDDLAEVPSVEKRKRFDRRRGSVERMSKRRITPTQPLVNGELYKIILCGDMGVGKSSFIFRTCKNEFNRHTRSTLGVDFQSKTLMLDSQQVVTLQLWDTAGQERFRSIAASYFRRADGVILLYDVTHQDTFLNVRDWMETIANSAPEGTPVMICGNKVDLRDTGINVKRGAVYQKEGAQLAASYGVLFMECSAASGLNVLTAVTLLARHLASRVRLQVDSGSIKDLTNAAPKEQSKCCFRN